MAARSDSSSPASGLSAVILAAGDGSRIRPMSERSPKAALPVANRALILHHLDTARNLGIGDVVVVVGAGGDALRSLVERDPASSGLRVQYVEQRERQGIAHAVGCAQPHVKGSFVLLLADVFMPDHRTRDAVELFRRTGCTGVLGAKEETDAALLSRNFSIEVAGDRGDRVVRVVEKPLPARPGLKGVGTYVFSPAIFDAIRRTPRSALRNEYELTDAVQVLIDSGGDVRSVVVTEEDINVNDAPSLLRANLAVLKSMNKKTLISDGAAIHPGARLDRVVIGAGATVGDGVVLTECVLFGGASVTEPGEYTRRIIAPGMSVDAGAAGDG